MTTLRRLLARETPFSYACNGCGRCCHDKRITLSPYELARLARAAGKPTRAILEEHTDEAGTVLRFEEGRGCTFLRNGACTVHEGRPLACRLYPLGRVVSQGREAFVELEPHPETEGTYGEAGDVAAWVKAQGGEPFVARAHRYHALLQRMAAILSARADGRAAFEQALVTETTVASDWQDIDAVVAEVCRERGEPEPTDLEARIDVHLDALDRWITSMEAVDGS